MEERVYAIAFALDATALEEHAPGLLLGPACAKAHLVLEKHGFRRVQGDIYFGDATVNSVECVLAAQDLAFTFPWFAPSVRYIRMFRIEETTDLSQALWRAPSARVCWPDRTPAELEQSR